MSEDDLRFLRTKLKSGEYDGADIMQAWLAIDRLVESGERIALLEAAILEYRKFRWKPDSRGWCLPYGDAEKKLFAVLQEKGE